MAELLKTGLTGLMAFQRALGTTGHNIANINTPGYSRQVVQFQAQEPQPFSGYFVGQGVVINGSTRIVDQFIESQVRTHISAHQFNDAYLGRAKTLDKLFSNENVGLIGALDEFFSSARQLTDAGGTDAARKAYIGKANALVNRFQFLNGHIKSEIHQINRELNQSTQAVNQLSVKIAELNKQIIDGKVQSVGEESSDLLDRRGVLLNELSELIQVHVEDDGTGAVTVSISNGQNIVVGDKSMKLSTIQNSEDATFYDVAMRVGGSDLPLSESLGGRLGGLISYRENMIKPTMFELGRLAIAMAEGFNEQHRLGVDLKGELGQEFFTDMNGLSLARQRIAAHSTNAGDAVFQIQIQDASALKAGEYQLSYDAVGSSYTLRRSTDGSVVAVFAAADLPYESASEGISIILDSGAIADGDIYDIRPTRYGAEGLAVKISDPARLALAQAAPIVSTTSSSANLNMESVVITGTAVPTAAVTLQFNASLNTLTASPSGDLYSFDPATDSGTVLPLNIAGFGQVMFSISGTPEDGDVFSFEFSGIGRGDLRNANALANLSDKKMVSDKTQSFFESYNVLVGDIGSKTQESAISTKITETVRRQSEDNRESVSGVNLNEEAANLMKFTQAYQAAARVIATSNQLFQTLISAVGG